MRRERWMVWSWGLHVAGGVAAVGIALGVQGVIGRALDAEVAALHAQRDEAERLVVRGEAIRAERELLRQRADATKGEIRTVLERIPDTARESDFLAQLTALAGRVGLHVVDFRPGAVNRHPNYSERTIELAARGEYPSICRFLEGLHDLSRLSTTVQMQVDAADGAGRYPLKMTLKIYFAPENAAVAATGAPDRG